MEVLLAPYVSERAKGNIKQYKYNGCDKSIIANKILQPFWRSAVEYLPLWMAPNLITLIGFFGIALSYVVTVYYAPGMKGELPSWIPLLNTATIFIYQTMDALDGKQARRTNSSSGLGELFDHCMDAITTFLVVLTFNTSIQTGVDLFTLFNIMSMLMAFYMTQWEQYHTDVMELGFIGVTEGQISMMVGHLLTFIFGTSFWYQKSLLFGIDMRYVPLIFSTIGAFATIFSNIYTVVKKGPKSVKGSIFQIIPIILVVAVAMNWAILSPSNIYHNNPHTYIITFGFLVAFLVGRIVLARICCDELYPLQIILLPLLLLIANFTFEGFNLFQYIPEITFLQAFCIATFIMYMHFAYVVITTLCEVLDIYCFKLKQKGK